MKNIKLFSIVCFTFLGCTVQPVSANHSFKHVCADGVKSCPNGYACVKDGCEWCGHEDVSQLGSCDR